GANMTSLTFSLSRALAKTWAQGDEILVTNLDHDANVTPWILAARDAGVTVRRVGIRPDNGTLDIDDFEAQLSARTRLVAVGYASNATGTINPIGQMIEQAHAVGAQVFVDAVHYAPHGLIDVAALDVDFLACSAYKFFGPHLGILYGRRSHLEQLDAFKLRPAPDALPQKWMTGTQSHEAIAGTAEAVKYLAAVHKEGQTGSLGLRDGLCASFDAIVAYERELVEHLLDGLGRLSAIRVWGITEKARFAERVPTVSCTHSRLSPEAIATLLGDQGIFVWHGNHYALPFTEAAGLEPQGTLRVGLLHYNTHDEVDRLLACLGDL
ncbi:MAG: cysteine desulfurase-like protein, partial [Planctomycetes bacterium]|nr:cysteine desulfurase-like protein [Planctomycetota bacterium]